ncbi:carbohydrate ABC transporter permease [Amnibacterium soli]|uniref:Carbohydrate ABC transporter permease n=1 Tax=Amnibacterium soli TaxID=1282736 RepID=A0ABP8Z3I7_9MICO
MSAIAQPRTAARPSRRPARPSLGAWLRSALLLVVTAVALVPLVPILLPLVVTRDGTFAPLRVLLQLGDGPALQWLLNSVLVTAGTVIGVLVVAAPAGYALSRGRSRALGAYAVVLFGLQSLPAMVLLPPLYVMLVQVGGIDDLVWLTVLYVGFSLAVATWTTTTWFSTLPIEVEEAAWLDGCTPFGAFVRMVLPNSGPALLSTALITFLFAWNEYWIALLFVQDQRFFTVGLALVSGGRSPGLAIIGLVPPVVVYLLLHRWFRFGGIADSAARA